MKQIFDLILKSDANIIRDRCCLFFLFRSLNRKMHKTKLTWSHISAWPDATAAATIQFTLRFFSLLLFFSLIWCVCSCLAKTRLLFRKCSDCVDWNGGNMWLVAGRSTNSDIIHSGVYIVYTKWAAELWADRNKWFELIAIQKVIHIDEIETARADGRFHILYADSRR